jgi:hypothetical protein
MCIYLIDLKAILWLQVLLARRLRYMVILLRRNFVSASRLLAIDKKEKALLWEIFHYEKMLDDNEEILLNDLAYYEERIRSIGNAKTPIEIGLLTIYMKHIKNIRTLLLNLQNNRHETLKKQIQDLSINPSSES